MSTPEEGPPPPGPSLPPHLKPPQNNTLRGQLLAINGAFAGVAILAVLLRIYVRTVMLRSFKADDYIMLAALVGSRIQVGNNNEADMYRLVASEF